MHSPNSPQPYHASLLFTEAGVAASTNVFVPRTEISMADFSKRLTDIGRTACVITDPKTNRPFEVAFANPDASTEGYDAEISTFSSSLSNDGNAIEFAQNAASHPNQKRVYIANFGNGGTAYFDKKEQRYIRDTGRYTIGKPDSCVALPSIQALHRALEHNDIHITRFSGVSAGNTVALALMNELPADQVTDAYLKGAVGAVDFLWPRLVYEMLITENILNSRRNKRESTDSWKPDSLKNDLAKIALYGLRAKNKLPKPEDLFTVHARQKAITDVLGFTRGPIQGDPLASSIAAALNHQTKALMTLHCGAHDVLYNGRTLDVVSGLLERAAALGGIALVEPRLQALVMNGTHADHTFEPSKRMAVEAAVFERSVTRPRSAYRAKSHRPNQWYRQS